MSAFEKVTHVIFDFDGTLVDSEAIVNKAVTRVATKYNKVWTLEVQIRHLGLPLMERCRGTWQSLEIPVSLDQFYNECIQECINVSNEEGMKLMPGVERLVKHLYEKGIPMAIGSGNTKRSFQLTCDNFGDFFTKHFSHVVLSDDPDVKEGKSSPDTFVVAAKRFNPPPKTFKNVLVIEDALNGVKAAIDAEMQCLLVPDFRIRDVKCEATLVINSLDDFKPELFKIPPFPN